MRADSWAVARTASGVASGVSNTSRQLGGALVIAVFGGLLATPATFLRGVQVSLLLAAAAAAVMAAMSVLLPTRKEF